MQSKKSIAAGKSDDAVKAEQISAQSKDLAPGRRMNVQTVQNLLLIWLDKNIDDNSADYQNNITHLRRVVNSISTFTDTDQCVDFLTDIYLENVCIIISGALCQNVVPLIHDVAQLHSIFIFCENKTEHEQWSKDWCKIKGIFTEISPICETVKQVAQQCEQNAISISFLAPSGDISKKNLDQLDPSFMYTQILKEILLTIKFEPKHFAEYIDHCRDVFAENEGELRKVKKLETEYRDKTPIWWYTCEGFLYPMLNRSLRIMDVDILIKMGFFIGDLHRHIQQLHKEQLDGHKFSKSFIVYRGQGMSLTNFEQLTKNKGGLISFNNFLSTSMNRDVSLLFAESNTSNPGLAGILFVLAIDHSKSSAPFASINGVSHFQEEDEVLFSMHTVFRICAITPMDGNHRLFQVELTLTSDNDKDLRVLTDHIREETDPNDEGWWRLGSVLLKMGQFDKAEEVYEILLEQTSEESKKACIYHQLGTVKHGQGEYQQAATYYKKSIEIKRKAILLDHHGLAISTVGLSVVYDSMGEYQKALLLYEEALQIYQKILPPNHPDLGMSYNNIGTVYDNMGEYSKALSSHEKALKIKQQSLPPNHPHLAGSYSNIGVVYYKMGEYSKALSSYEKALEIQTQSLLPNHPALASSYNNTGSVYLSMGEYSKALSSYEKALEIRQQSLPPNHPELASGYDGTGLVYNSMGEYSKALSSHEKALEIKQQSLPSNHPDLATSYNNIGAVYDNMDEYSKALSSYKKALEIRQQSLPPNHPDLAISYNNIGFVYENMGEYSKALSSYKKVLQIKQQSHPPNHPDLAKSYIVHGIVYNKMGEHSKAITFYEKALEIQRQSLPPNDPDLAMSYNNIGLVYENMSEYSKARSFYERAVDIVQQSLPANHPELQICRNNLDRIKKKL